MEKPKDLYLVALVKYDYRWGPGSKRIAVEVNSGGTEENIWIGVIEVSDGKITQLTTGDGDAFLGGWSPDGQWLILCNGWK